LFVVVRVTLYGFAVVAEVLEGEGDGTEVVEALAMPRKCFNVEGRGRAIGLRNERDIEEAESCVRLLMVFSPDQISVKSRMSQKGKLNQKRASLAHFS
jgi:hypothetical protein